MLPGMVCYAEKQGNHFWPSSLGQMVQFDTIIFGRTFKNYFCQFVWIGKKKIHYNSRVSLHEAPTKNTEIQFTAKSKSKFNRFLLIHCDKTGIQRTKLKKCLYFRNSVFYFNEFFFRHTAT